MRRRNGSTLSLSVVLCTALVGPAGAQVYRFQTVHVVQGTHNRLLSTGINNARDVIWSGPTQEGPQIYLNSPRNNIAQLDPLASTIIDSRLPRFGTHTQNTVWVASTGEIDPVTRLASPGSRYQEDRIYRYAPGHSATPTVVGSTVFVQDGAAVSAVTDPDVNDAGQAVFRRLNYRTFRWSLAFHGGSGDLSDTRDLLTDYALVTTPFLSNSGKVVFTARQNPGDPIQMYLYDSTIDLLTLLPTGINWGAASLRDFSNDDVALAFAGSPTTGSFYTIDTQGNATPVLTAGTGGLTRIELGQRNSKGQIVFANRTVPGSGGASPSFGLSNLMLYDNGNLIRLTDNPPGVSIRAAAINDYGDIAFITQQYLYENGVYTGQRELRLIVAQAVPEPGSIALLCGLIVGGAGITLRVSARWRHSPGSRSNSQTSA